MPIAKLAWISIAGRKVYAALPVTPKNCGFPAGSQNQQLDLVAVAKRRAAHITQAEATGFAQMFATKLTYGVSSGCELSERC
jgi:hypothetical protein